MCNANRHVRFTPKSDIKCDTGECPLWVKSGHWLSRQIAFHVLRHGLPAMSESRDGVAADLLVSYGPNQAETFRRAGVYMGRILKGEKPADLPVIQPTNFELFINLSAAKALGIQIPGQLLGRADELIE